MIWLHFGKGHSGCFERRETVEKQDCGAQNKLTALAVSHGNTDASLHHGDRGGGGEKRSDS